jgi:hypothetical protein
LKPPTPDSVMAAWSRRLSPSHRGRAEANVVEGRDMMASTDEAQ